MKKSNIWLKAITLILFLSLLIGFVIFKSDLWEQNIEEEPVNENLVSDTETDSISDIDESLIIPSSKSGMPFPPEKKKKMMSGSKSLSGEKIIEIEKVDTREVDSNEMIIIPSSKSAPVFEPKAQSPK